jgi:hypothetical protein
MPPPRKDKKYIAKLLNHSLRQHTSTSSTTTTRRHITAAGVSKKEVPRPPRSKPIKDVIVEPLLDAPQEEEADGVGKDGLEAPADDIHDPEKLSEEQTQVSFILSTFVLPIAHNIYDARHGDYLKSSFTSYPNSKKASWSTTLIRTKRWPVDVAPGSSATFSVGSAARM